MRAHVLDLESPYAWAAAGSAFASGAASATTGVSSAGAVAVAVG